MQISLDLIQNRINQGIKESVESLQDYPLELRFDHSRGVLTEFLKDDSYTREQFTLMNFDDRDNFRVADHLIFRRSKGRGLYIVGRSTTLLNQLAFSCDLIRSLRQKLNVSSKKKSHFLLTSVILFYTMTVIEFNLKIFPITNSSIY